MRSSSPSFRATLSKAFELHLVAPVESRWFHQSKQLYQFLLAVPLHDTRTFRHSIPTDQGCALGRGQEGTMTLLTETPSTSKSSSQIFVQASELEQID